MSDHFLWGLVSYGDSVEDEWFIVSLLWKLTETFPSLIIHVWDDDGEFLLIESAYALPKWITPETSTNRYPVFETFCLMLGFALEYGSSKEQFILYLENIPKMESWM